MSFRNRGIVFWGPYNRDPIISGTILGTPIFGNSYIASWIEGCTLSQLGQGSRVSTESSGESHHF